MVVTTSRKVPFASRMYGKYLECHTTSKVLTTQCRAMNHDPDVYGADAHEFNPSRHLDTEGKIKPAPVDTKEESHGKVLWFHDGNEFKNCDFSIVRVRAPNVPRQVRPCSSCHGNIYIVFGQGTWQMTHCLSTLRQFCGLS